MCVVYISWKILTKHGTIFWPRRGKKHHQNFLFSIRGAYFWKIEVRSLISQGFGQGYYARLSLPDSNRLKYSNTKYLYSALYVYILIIYLNIVIETLFIWIKNIFVCKYLLIFTQVCIFVDELKTKISNYGNFI